MGPRRPSAESIPTELADEGGRWPLLAPLPDGRDESEKLPGWIEDGGEVPAGRAASYGPPL
jgi:hypothetical protein